MGIAVRDFVQAGLVGSGRAVPRGEREKGDGRVYKAEGDAEIVEVGLGWKYGSMI